MRPPLVPVALSLLCLAGCAPHDDQYSRDLAVCRRSAEQDMGPDAVVAPGDEQSSAPMVMARREKLTGDYQTKVDQCMGLSSAH